MDTYEIVAKTNELCLDAYYAAEHPEQFTRTMLKTLLLELVDLEEESWEKSLDRHILDVVDDCLARSKILLKKIIH
jgi:hypothetical protein